MNILDFNPLAKRTDSGTPLVCSMCKSIALRKTERINRYATRYVCLKCAHPMIYLSRFKPQVFENKKEADHYMGNIYSSAGMPLLDKKLEENKSKPPSKVIL